jgi:hypothetical protein
LDYIPDSEQPADILTKSVVKENFNKKRKLMGIQDKPEQPGAIDHAPERTRTPTENKRKALSSVIVNPKRPNVFYSIALLLLLVMGTMGSVIVTKLRHKPATSVIWRKSHNPVVTGFESVNIAMMLISPCSLIPKVDVKTSFRNMMIEQCNTAYEDMFLKQLEKICPKNTILTGRQKRFIQVAGLFLIGVIASAGIGIGGYAVSQTNKLESRTDELQKALDELERKVYANGEEVQFLKKEMLKLSMSLDQVVRDLHVFQARAIEVHYLISYLIGKLLEGRKALQTTERSWKRSELESGFFDYLNITLPCGDHCPIELGTFHSCTMNDKREQIAIDITVPILNNNYTNMIADPFVLMEKKRNMTCRLEYYGPKKGTVSVKEDCIYDVTQELIRDKFTLANPQQCMNYSAFQQGESYYRKDSCKLSKDGDERSFVQVKIFDNEYYVYCPNNQYEIGNRALKCPKRVFTLPIGVSFTINGRFYNGAVMRIVFQQKQDPLLVAYTNWHLTPEMNWDNLTGQLEQDFKNNEDKIAFDLKRINGFKFSSDDNEPKWHHFTSSIIIIILALTQVAVFIICKIQKRKANPRRHAHDEESGSGLMEINHPAGQTNHQIIIEE